MISIEFVTIAVHDPDAAGEAYGRLLGREPEIQDGLGNRRFWFRFPNLALEVVGPIGEGASADTARHRLESHGEGLWWLGLGTDELDETVLRLDRRGLSVKVVQYMRRSGVGDAHGVPLSLVTRRVNPQSPPIGPQAATVAALDHLLVHTPNPDRALGAYGARLGFDLQLDREDPQRGVRQMSFQCGDVAIEVLAGLEGSAADGPDRLSGLAWRVDDAEAAKAHLTAAGFDVSDVRAGRQPGTRVITVRDAPVGVPTTMIQPAPAKESA